MRASSLQKKSHGSVEPATSVITGQSLPLRVLHVLPSLAESYGGPAQAMVHFVDVLSDQGVDVSVVACLGETQRAVHLESRARLGARGSVEVRTFAPFSRLYSSSPAMFWWLRRNVARFHLVHVHGLFSFAPVVAGFLGVRAGVPLIVRPFGVLNRYGLERRRPWAKRVSIALVEGPLLRRASAMQFTSAAELDQATEAGLAHNGVVLPLGLPQTPCGDPELIRARFPRLRAGSVLLSLSRLDRAKNIEALLDAFALVGRDHPEASLLVCGDGAAAYRAAVEQRALQLGLGESVIWAGDVRGSMKASAFAVADVFVLPSFSENFGISVVEAMAAGKPVVVTRGVPMHDTIEQAGAGLVAGTDAASLAAAFGRCLDGRFDLQAAGIRARELADEEFSLASFSKRLLQLYGRVLEHSRCARTSSEASRDS